MTDNYKCRKYSRNWWVMDCTREHYLEGKIDVVFTAKIVKAIKKIGLKDAKKMIDEWGKD